MSRDRTLLDALRQVASTEMPEIMILAEVRRLRAMREGQQLPLVPAQDDPPPRLPIRHPIP